jgi:hypothetical protein
MAVRATRIGRDPPSWFFVAVAYKGLNIPASLLESVGSVVVGGWISVDSKADADVGRTALGG